MSKLRQHQKDEIETQFAIMTEAVRKGFNIIKAIEPSFAFAAIQKLSEPYENERQKELELADVEDMWNHGLLDITQREEQEKRILERYRHNVVDADPRRTPITTK